MIRVNGTPVAKGSKKAYVVRGRAVIVDVKSKQLKAWEAKIKEEYTRQCADEVIGKGPVMVFLNFRLQKPKTATRTTPYVKPDIDKLCRAVLDALTKVAFKDDSQVTTIFANKSYGKPGVDITVTPVLEVEDADLRVRM